MATTQSQREHYEIERELADRLRGATSEERRRLYGEVYRERSERIPQHPLVHQAADPAARAAAVAPQVRLLRPFLLRAQRFCELGAGDGAVARAVAPLVDHSLALDVTDTLALPRHPTTGYEFRVFNGFDLGIDDGSLDVAYSFDVVEHLHPDDALDHARAVRRALRPGGVYVCVTQNRLSGPHDISRHFSDIPRGFHLREYTVGELADVLHQAGFKRTKILLTVSGRRLSPQLPSVLVRPLEAVLEMTPPRARRRLARVLAAVKVVAAA